MFQTKLTQTSNLQGDFDLKKRLLNIGLYSMVVSWIVFILYGFTDTLKFNKVDSIWSNPLHYVLILSIASFAASVIGLFYTGNKNEKLKSMISIVSSLILSILLILIIFVGVLLD